MIPSVSRPRKFVESDVIDQAGDVFAANGYAGTTLDDLVKATGLGKQSLYNTFGGKRELFLKTLSARTSEALAAVDEALSGPDSTPLERIRAQILKLAVALSDGDAGDLLVTKATLERAGQDTAVADTAVLGLDAQADIYRHCIIDAQHSGEIDSQADAAALAEFFVAVSRGMEVIGNAGIGRAKLTAIALTSLQAIPLAAPRPRPKPHR
jgi:TetR/AcrR family transcriptional regulator, transcriptional repressor for nem operon